MMDMEPYLRQYHAIIVQCGLTPQPYESWRAWATDNAELWPLMKGGQMIGGVFFKGQTVHIAVLPEWQGRWLTKELLAAYQTWTHTCEIVAHPPADNERACTLAKRLGFQFRERSGQFNLFIKEPTPCLQS